MAIFPLRDKEKEREQLPLLFSQSLVGVSAELYNALVRAAVRKMGEKQVKKLRMDVLLGIEREWRKQNPESSIVVTHRHVSEAPLYLTVERIEAVEDQWECAVHVKVHFPVAGSRTLQDARERDHFLAVAQEVSGIFGRVESGGLALRVLLFGSDIPVKQEYLDECHGKAWKYFQRKGEIA